MYGDANAIASIAELSGNTKIAETFRNKARQIKQLVQMKLWDEQEQFFKVLINQAGLDYSCSLPEDWYRCNHIERFKLGELVDVCELSGYTPWYFNLPDPGYEGAWKKLMDKEAFYAAFGPTTAEQSSPYFMLPHTHECLWNGPSWPFATTQTLTALANLLNNYKQSYVINRDYFELLCNYTKSHFLNLEDGSRVPWIDENLHPYTGEWLARNELHKRKDEALNRGKDYNHSGYCDLIISGLVGIRPRWDDVLEVNPLIPDAQWSYFCLDKIRYHNREITIVYDGSGERYGLGKGLRVMVDGKEAANSEVIEKLLVNL
ncbi:MGH1-like glycoside hydrolase domain-containing protein [Paenibacillus eucommiae]|uniref:Uncharacterized protein n=1 Tax=Paenibacillus eucommiae TaxID=1355755 RepID=A0ABS4IR56_9BACL|nr:glycosyl hydrolase family 65 protein [Paenibacillus eucommiae]MBP1989084.1 hypothetical protein [Paenibacillus eucommiae]